MRVFRKSISVLMILVLVLTMFPLGSKTVSASTASDFQPIIPGQQWFFDTPNAVAVDGSGNIYVGTYASDENPYQVTRLSPAGVILDSWGILGEENGQINELADIAVDGDGNVYVADSGNNRVQKFMLIEDYHSFQMNLESDGNGEYPMSPNGVAVDGDGNIYVSYMNDNRVEKFNSSGQVVTDWWSQASGYQFSQPTDIAVDLHGNVYVADMGNNRIQKYDSAGGYLGTIESSEESDFSLNMPMGLAVDGSDNLYVTELMNHRVQKFSPAGSSLGTLGGAESGTGPGEFIAPGGVAVDSSGNIYVLDTQNSRVQKFSEFNTESFELEWGSFGGANDQFRYPNGIAVDSAGNVYVSDSGNYRIQKFSSIGKSIEKWGSPGVADGQFLMPGGTLDSNNNIYVVDSGNNRVQKLGATAPAGYTVTFDSNGGSLVAAISNVAVNTTVDLPTPPTKAGYTFAGWYKDNGVFGNGFTSATPVTGNITVYAKWTAVGAPSGFVPIIPDEQWFFGQPYSVAVDSNGNVYVADTGNHRILKYDPSGIFLETWGVRGTSAGQFTSPYGIAVDSEGNAYVTDMLNNRVQKRESATGVWTTWGSNGGNDGEFRTPTGIAVDTSGNVYVVDTNNSRVQKFDSDGNYITEWGSGGNGQNQFSMPYGIAVSSSGSVYVADSNNHRIQVFSSTGTHEATWGGTSGSGEGQFKSPSGVAVDSSGNVYVADNFNHRIQKFNSIGEHQGMWGEKGLDNGQFTNPSGIAADSMGNVYVADNQNNRVQKFDSTGAFLAKWGSKGSEDGELNLPYAMAVDINESIYVADTENNRIQKFDSTGEFVAAWGEKGTENGQFNSPQGIAVDRDGNVYVTDALNNRVQKFNSTGIHQLTFGNIDNEDGLKRPTGIAVDSSGNIYVADAQNFRIQKFDSSGTSLLKWGSEGEGNGNFINPKGIALDSGGNVYVIDAGNNSIQKFQSTGDFISRWGEEGENNGQLMYPYGIAVDSGGNIYVADTENYRVQKFSSAGASLAKWGSYGNGSGLFSSPYGIAVDTYNNVYVADTYNHRIQKLSANVPSMYTVTFDSNGGSTVTAISNVAANSTVTLPNAPTKSGYDFAGWYTDNGTFAHRFTDTTPVTGNVTVYAKWTRASSDDDGPSTPTTPTSPVTPPTTVTGDIKNGTTGNTVANITATVTKESNNRLTLTMPAAQLVVVKQPDGTTGPLIDVAKVAITSETGTPLAVSADGTLQVSSLAQGTDHTYKLSYDFGKGQKINLGTLEIKIDEAGNVSELTVTLIDPYGILTDGTTGEVIAGAHITLYYADTARNKAAGKTPGSLVELPILEDFKPNSNRNPQLSDVHGAYGFMVFPITDYYLVATKEGYEEYKSPTISVEQDIVKWDIQMMKPSPGVNRLAGLTRVDTALAIAKAAFPGKVNHVILATAGNYPDALAGSVLAYQLNAPILLVGSTEADQAKVIEYINNSMDKAGEVYILGGTGVVGADMEAKIVAKGFNHITRLAGKDRYETALKIAERLGVKTGTPIILAYGESYPDALSVSSIAARMQSPIFLVPKDGLSKDIKEAMTKIRPAKVYLIGGTGVISTAVAAQTAQLTSLDQTNIVRIAGQDRYETSLAVAQYFNEAGGSLCLATGNNFPDALAGSVYAAKCNAPILLVDSSLSNSLSEYVKARNLTGITLFGGEGAVTKEIEEQLKSWIGK